MTMRSLLLVVLLGTVQAAVPAGTRIDPANVAFGYTDQTGTRLLVLALEDNVSLDATKARQLVAAVCAEGQVLPIQYLSMQVGSAGGNGRQGARNFAHESGPLFEITTGHAAASDTCMLVPADYIAAFPIVPNELPMTERGTPANASRQAVIEKAKGRSVKFYWPLFRSAPAQQVAAVEFAPEGDSLLGAVVLVESAHLSFMDMPASIKKGEKDGGCWRVDDECHFGADGMKVQAVLGSPGRQLIFITLDGAEGKLILLLLAQDGVLVKLKNAYRYQAPI